MIECASCHVGFDATERQKMFVQKGLDTGMPFVMLECPSCKAWFKLVLNPDHLQTPGPVSRCPAPHCTGWVCDISTLPDEENKWGCGECGNTWLDDSELQRAIANIVGRYAHRSVAYKQVDGRWYGVPLADQPEGYERIVETEDYE
jgi:hypothetical protein